MMPKIKNTIEYKSSGHGASMAALNIPPIPMAASHNAKNHMRDNNFTPNGTMSSSPNIINIIETTATQTDIFIPRMID